MIHWSVRQLATAVLLMFGSVAQSVFAAEIHLTWNPNPESDIAGYKVYATDLTTTNNSIFNVGRTNEISFAVEPGHGYAFRVTAYNLAGLESAPSQEVRYNVPDEYLAVSWDRSAYSAVVNYRLSYGLLNQPAQQVAVGNVISFQLQNLQRGSNYFFYVEGFNSSGQKLDAWQQKTVELPTEEDLVPVHLSRLNSAPQVAITSPAPNASFVAPATISISANASDADGGIRSVDFYSGSTRLVSDTSAPYSYSWTGVAAGTYQIAAVAFDTTGASTRVTVNVTVAPSSSTSSIPPAPTSLAGTSTQTSVQLNWAHSGSNETGFRVYRSSGGSGYALITTLAANTLSYLNSGLASGTGYSYRVTAFNSAGESAPASLTISTKSAALAAPAGVTASTVNGTIVIGWSATTGATQYQVERSTSASGPFQAVGTTQITQWTDSQVIAGTTYFYRVIANANGVLSAPSTIVSAAIQGSMPLAPSNLTGSGEKGYVRLAWRDDSSNESSFIVERSLDGVSFSQIATLGANSASYTDQSVAPRRRYHYRVWAANSAGKRVSSTITVRTR